jgi:hypothetical protein
MKRSHSETFPGLTIPVPLSNGGGGDQYLYIILKYTFGKYRYSFHRIRVSDLMVSSSSKRSHSHGHEKPQKLPKPILKLPSDRYPIFMGFFSAGSKIYMFGGEELCTGRRGLASRNCYVFDTCQKNNPSKVVKEGPPMVFGKYHPVVLGPLHGKFYVLDSTLASNHLEEFDPQTETWTPLPSAPIAPPKEEEDDRCFFLFTTIAKKYKVVSQAIVGDRILLSTQEKGIYAFHVISHTWEHWSSLDRRGNARLPYSSGSEFHRGFWYAFPDRRYAAPPYYPSAYYFDEDNRLFRPYRAHGVRRPSRLVDCRTNNRIVPMGDRTLFVVRSGYAHSDRPPYHITVDMCKFTRFKVKNGGKPEDPEVSKQYSATFTHEMPGIFEFIAACLVVAST